MRSDPYNIKYIEQLKEDQGYNKCSYNCDSCKNFVDETTYIVYKATSRKYEIRRDTSCNSKNAIHVVNHI